MNKWIELSAAITAYMSVWYIIAVVQNRNDVADVAWGIGFVLVAWLSFSFSPQAPRAALVNTLVTIWGLRLAFYIGKRNFNKPEDFRYQKWRSEWKNFYWRSFWQVFMLQGLLILVVSIPVVYINLNSLQGLHWPDAVGTAVWITGFYIESTADRQLTRFKKNPVHHNKIITTGLWRYSRHPNYFGEVLQWWGIFVLALNLPYGWLTFIGPLSITLLIRYVSGVPLLENKYQGHPEFEAYKKVTPVFFPRKPAGFRKESEVWNS